MKQSMKSPPQVHLTTEEKYSLNTVYLTGSTSFRCRHKQNPPNQARQARKELCACKISSMLGVKNSSRDWQASKTTNKSVRGELCRSERETGTIYLSAMIT